MKRLLPIVLLTCLSLSVLPSSAVRAESTATTADDYQQALVAYKTARDSYQKTRKTNLTINDDSSQTLILSEAQNYVLTALNTMQIYLDYTKQLVQAADSIADDTRASSLAFFEEDLSFIQDKQNEVKASGTEMTTLIEQAEEINQRWTMIIDHIYQVQTVLMLHRLEQRLATLKNLIEQLRAQTDRLEIRETERRRINEQLDTAEKNILQYDKSLEQYVQDYTDHVAWLSSKSAADDESTETKTIPFAEQQEALRKLSVRVVSTQAYLNSFLTTPAS